VIAFQQRVRSLAPEAALGWLIAILIAIGAVMEVAASYVLLVENPTALVASMVHEAMWIVLGVAAFFVARRVPLSRWLRLGPLAGLATVAMLCAVMVPGIGRDVGGAARWFQLGPIQLQPSEVAKLGLVLFLGNLVARRTWRRLVGPALVMTAACAGLILLEPDMGTAIVVGSIGFAALVVAGAPRRTLAAIGGGGILVGLVGAFSRRYRELRLMSFLHPWRYRLTYSYQEVQALNAFASGRIVGTGLGSGLANWGYVPNAPTDFIFAVIGQDFGLVGALLVMVALAALVVVVLVVAERARQPGERAVAFCIGIWLLVQVVLNIGAVIGLLPVTGVPLPLISAGGSATVTTLAALGLVAQIAHRQARRLQ